MSRRTTGFEKPQKLVKAGDRISHLPDGLLTFILSFLSTKESVRTSLLSTRWKLLWASVPALHLSFWEFNPKGNHVGRRILLANFSNFVNRFLLKDSPPCIGKLHLSGWGSCQVEPWINAVKDHVQEMELEIPPKDERDPPSEFPKCLFMCQMLVVLKLQLNIVLDITVGSICFPYLKVLELDSIKFKEGISAQNLISSCPVLEDLKIIRNEFGDNLKIPEFVVASQTLKRLKLCSFYKCSHDSYETDARIKLVIDTPALRFLDILDEFSSDIVVGEMGSVSKANLSLHGRLTNEELTEESLFAKCLFKLLRAIYNTEYLVLSDVTVEALAVADCYEFPTFNNLTHLGIYEVFGMHIDLKFITEFIKRSPNLELINKEWLVFRVKEADWMSHPDVAKAFEWM